MRFYAAKNVYGSESSIGFANTWSVLVFNDKLSRDNFVDDAGGDNISIRRITRAQIKDYIDAPKPFTGQRRAIDTHAAEGGAPFFGAIELMYPGEGVDL